MMDLDEAIQHCKEVADEKEEDAILYHNCATYKQNLYEKGLAENTEKECRACAEEHQQLAEWLKELKAYREGAGMKLLIDIPEHIYEHAKETTEDSRDEFEAMRAIANGSQQESCGDAISRQAAIRAIEALQRPIMREESNYYQFKFSGMSEALGAVENLPSISPQPRTGRWVKQNYGWNWQCSECGFVTPPSAKEIFTFCPKCGAKMEVEE